MVNHGVSRACLTCKTRRIRCDEGRPSCERCIKSRRTCLGYKGETDNILRQNTLLKAHAATTLSITQGLGSALNLLDIESDAEVRNAFAKFFSDFVLVPKDRSISRGYFDGLGNLLATAGPSSEVSRAARAVALANAANTSGSQDLLHKAHAEHAATILAFQESLTASAKCNDDEKLMTAALLGLYEMMIATEVYPEAHSTHIRGVSAILSTRDSHLDIVPGLRLFRCVTSIFAGSLSELEDFSTPSLLSLQPYSKDEPSPQNLDALMLRGRPVFLRAAEVLSNPKASKADLNTLKQQALLLNKEFSLWPLCQLKEWAPQTLGVIKQGAQSNGMDSESMPFWPGKVDSYYDLFVVAVWDTYRKGRLKLLQVVADCTERLRGTNDPQETPATLQKLQNEVRELVDGLCASIPFHLVADLQCCLQLDGIIERLHTPGKALGGLLLMYPLYIASTLPLVPKDQRAWMKGRLRWIGKHMGIHQATMLASTNEIHHFAIADGHALVFSGSLISPPAASPSSGSST